MRRMFICDPVCVLPFGHNAPAMSYFRSFFRPDFERIECCVGRPFDAVAAAEHDFRPCFSYLYEEVMPLEASGYTEPPQAAGAWPSDAASSTAKADYLDVIARDQLGPDDLFFLPSADFHSVHGLIAAIRTIAPRQSPRILLRLIGVMENAGHVVVEPLQHLCAAIESARRDGYSILVAAETPAYASHLAGVMNDVAVAMLPYPLLGDMLPPPSSDRFVVASAGSARFDKGYLDLAPIIRDVRRRCDGIDIQFRIQSLTDRHVIHQQSYTNQLYALPGVELLPAILSASEMRSLYEGCHAVLLPYDHGVYRLRGSAVLMEAIAYGRYAIGRADLGFSSQIQYYQNGAVCDTLEQFASAIIEVARRPAALLRRQLALARDRYRADTAGAYRAWMESCFA